MITIEKVATDSAHLTGTVILRSDLEAKEAIVELQSKTAVEQALAAAHKEGLDDARLNGAVMIVPYDAENNEIPIAGQVAYYCAHVPVIRRPL